MSVQITIIGTGQIGASIGLALGAYKDKFVRVGHDKDPRAASQAKALGAVDRVNNNLAGSVKDSEIVILALPLDQIQDTLKYIALDLKYDAVVMDTAPIKQEVMQWAKESLPARCHYIGLVPVINPAYLDTPGSGVESAHDDLFKNGLMAIVSPQGVPSEAIKLATDFTQLLGAEHMFMDPMELDSMMSATYILPQLLAVALLNTSVDQPGWYEARKLTGHPYAAVTNALDNLEDEGSLALGAVAAHTHLERQIDRLVDYLTELRRKLSTPDADSLLKEIAQARLGRLKWLKDRTAGNWAEGERGSKADLPSARDIFAHMFTFGGGRKPKQTKESK